MWEPGATTGGCPELDTVGLGGAGWTIVTAVGDVADAAEGTGTPIGGGRAAMCELTLAPVAADVEEDEDDEEEARWTAGWGGAGTDAARTAGPAAGAGGTGALLPSTAGRALLTADAAAVRFLAASLSAAALCLAMSSQCSLSYTLPPSLLPNSRKHRLVA